MKKVFAGVGKIVLSVFTVAVIGLMALLSYETLGRVYPTDPMKQMYGLVLFSGGTIAWFVIFMFASRSGQRPLALTLFAVSLVGEVIYSAADVFMGGQSWVDVNPNLGQYVLWTFIAMTFAHGISLYIHFMLEPGKLAMIEVESMQDRAQDEALKKATQMVEHRIDPMADILAGRTMVNVLTGLSLPLPPEFIQAKVTDIEPTPRSVDKARPAAQLPAGDTVLFGKTPAIIPTDSVPVPYDAAPVAVSPGCFTLGVDTSEGLGVFNVAGVKVEVVGGQERVIRQQVEGDLPQLPHGYAWTICHWNGADAARNSMVAGSRVVSVAEIVSIAAHLADEAGILANESESNVDIPKEYRDFGGTAAPGFPGESSSAT